MSSSPPISSISSSFSISSQPCTCPKCSFQCLCPVCALRYPRLDLSAVSGASNRRGLAFVWRGERLPTSTVLTLTNPCCVPLQVRVKRSKNGARVSVRPNIVTIQPHAAEEVLFVQPGLSRENAASASFKIVAASQHLPAENTFSLKISAAVIDPPEESTTQPSDQSSRILQLDSEEEGDEETEEDQDE